MKIPFRALNRSARRSARRATEPQKIPFQAAVMTNPAKHLLAEIQELAPAINSRAAEIEAARRGPPHLAGALKSLGAFRVFVAPGPGGLPRGPPPAPPHFSTPSPLDGSVSCDSLDCGRCG